MATKCVRKLMLVMMMKLLILILLGVQANDLAPTSLSPSSSLIMSPYSFELDNHGEIHLCLTLGICHCSNLKTTWPHPDATYEACIFATFLRCFKGIKNSEDPIMFPIIFNCAKTKCERFLKIEDILLIRAQLVRCLLKCFNKHVASPSDVIYLQNP
jgi:hypothetical protein